MGVGQSLLRLLTFSGNPSRTWSGRIWVIHHTRLEIDGDYHFTQWFASLMTPLIMPAAAKKMEGDIATLKKLVENEGRS